MKLIDADKLSADMYHEAFEKDSDMQKWDSGCWIRYKMFENVLKAQPTAEAPDINVGNMDTTTRDSIPAKTGKNDGDRTSGGCISRAQAIDKFIDGLEEIFADLRERHVDDSVCGLCEYDGAYMGQSGDWCNECPGFDRDDCFKLSDKIRKEWTDEIIKALPSVQPERKDALEKAVAVEAISDELMSRFDISATYAYEIAEKAMNRIEEMAKEMGKGEQDG